MKIERMKTLKIKKKSQEEMVGFVLIMVLVAVIILVFLSLSIKRTPTTYMDSKEAKNFIDSLMMHTTDCVIYGSLENIEDLIKNCYEGKSCSNNLGACEELNSSLSELLEKSWPVGNTEDSKYSYYSFLAYYTGYGQNISIVTLSKGNCTGRKIGAEHPTENINSIFEVCISKAM